MTEPEVLAFGPRPQRPAARDSLLRQAEGSLRAVEVSSTMLSDRLRLLRSGGTAPGGHAGLPAARVVSPTAARHQLETPTSSDEEPPPR